MKPSTVSVIFLIAVLSASAQSLPSLLDALRASGASKFADQIEVDPTIAALYLSDQVQTVFAPRDDTWSGSFASTRKRQSLTPEQQQALLLQCTQGQATLQSMRTLPGGSQIVTQDSSPKLKGKKQSLVSDARHKNNTKTTKATKRGFTRPLYPPTWAASEPSVNITRPFFVPTWTAGEPSSVKITRPLYPPTWTNSAPSSVSITHSFYPPQWTASAPYYPPKETASTPYYPPKETASAPYFPHTWPTSAPYYPHTWPTSAPYYPHTWTTSTPYYPPAPTPSPTPLVQIYSGLGNSVNVIQADIPYAGGHIQITDGKFTLPAPLSVTEQAVGINTFASLASSANLTDTFDSIPYSTFFIPSDEAFASFNASTPSTATANLLEGHLIPDFVGYLPSLVNGSTLTTQAGSIVTVTIRGDDYYINDALIVSSNIILDNGVAHVIDGVLTPAQVFTGAASSTIQKGNMGAFAAAVTAALFLAIMV